MIGRNGLLFSTAFKSKKLTLIKEIEEQIKKFDTQNVSEFSEYLDLIKERNYTISISKKTNFVFLRKDTNMGPMNIFFRCIREEAVEEECKKIMNSDSSPEFNYMVDLLNSGENKISPLDFRVSLEKGDLVQVFECHTLGGEMVIKTGFITGKEGFVMQDFKSSKRIYRPLFDYEKKNCLGMHFIVMLRNLGVDRTLLEGIEKIAEFHYFFMRNRWMEKVIKALS